MSMIDVVALSFQEPQKRKASVCGRDQLPPSSWPDSPVATLLPLPPPSLLSQVLEVWAKRVQHMKAGARHSTCIFPTNSTFTANDSPTEQARGRTPSGGHRQANTSRLGLSQEHKRRLYQPQRTTIRILGPVCNMSGMQRRMRLSRYRYTILRLCVYLG